jgi:hypothetical protein
MDKCDSTQRPIDSVRRFSPFVGLFMNGKLVLFLQLELETQLEPWRG